MSNEFTEIVNHRLNKPGVNKIQGYKETELDVGGVDDGLLPEEGNFPRRGDDFPDINLYQHKKTLAQGMMDLALLSANANQLRYVLEKGEKHSYYYSSLVLITVSLVLQVTVGIGLIWNSRYNVKKDNQMHLANKVNNLTVIGIFIITVLNVFISAFGVQGTEEFGPLVESLNLENLTETVI